MNSFRKRLLIVMLSMLILSYINLPVEAKEPQVIFNGHVLILEMQPIVEDDLVLVPFRDIFTAMGANINYDSKENCVLAIFNGVSVKLPIGTSVAYVNDMLVNNSVSNRIIRGRTMIPLDFISKYFGLTVWVTKNNEELLIYINTPGFYNEISCGIPILISDIATNRSTAYTMSNKIVTCELGGVRKTHFAYSKNDGTEPYQEYKSISTWIATYNNVTRKIESDTFIGYQFDNHGSPALTIDKDGYLHIAYGPHGNAPLQYRRSLRPNDSTGWSEIEYISTNLDYEITYPIIKVDGENNIHIVGSCYNKAVYIKKETGGRWSQVRIINSTTKEYSRYHVCMDIDRNNNIHILVPDLRFDGDPDDDTADMDLYYYKSGDRGESFSKALRVWGNKDGRGYYNTLAVDEQGNPHFTIIRRQSGKEKNIWHVYYDSKTWRKNAIQIPAKSIFEAKIMIDNKGKLFIIAQVSDEFKNSGWNHVSNQLFLVSAEKRNPVNYDYEVDRVVGSDPNVVWLPTIEENQQHSEIKNSFWLMYNVGKEEAVPCANLKQNKNYIMQLNY